MLAYSTIDIGYIVAAAQVVGVEKVEYNESVVSKNEMQSYHFFIYTGTDCTSTPAEIYLVL